jgi:hypothetical protein
MSNSSTFVRLGLSLWTAVASFASTAEPPSFKISEIYSNLDGSTQFIRLTESQGMNGQHHFGGLMLTTTHDVTVKQFTFLSDLSTDQTANLFWRLITYNGSVPYTNAPLTELPPRLPGPDWSSFSATEHWAALVNDAGFGLGVFNPAVFSWRRGKGAV